MKINSVLLATSMLALPLLAPPTHAQNTNQSNQLEEIIVTAQRREQNLVEVPLSIQAATGEQLTNIGIRDMTSLQFITPGYMTQTDSGFTQIYIRGIGNAIFIGADPSVATFVDDVPRIYGSMADNLVDVERVEVLKGAQGGLYGRNATGGVVNIITRQPSTDEFKGDALLDYGEKGTFRAASYLNVPLSDKLAWSVAGERDTHHAYVKNTASRNPYTAAMFPDGSFLGTSQETADFFNAGVNPSKLADQDFWSARTKLLFKPSANFTITLAGDAYDKHDNNGAGYLNMTPAYTQAAITGLFGPGSLGITTDFPAGLVQGPTGKFSSSVGSEVSVFTREKGTSLTVVWNGPGFDLTSITAYRNQHTFLNADAITATLPAVPLTVRYHKYFAYQELRAVSTFEGPWHLLGGATYLDNNLAGSTDVFLLSHSIPIATTKVSDQVHNWSAYAEAGYDFSDDWTFTVSGRYMHEKNEAHFTLPVDSAASTVEKKFVPSATLSYKLDDGTIYARWAKGFKTGGINLVTAPIFYPSPSDGSLFDPETVDTYEVGYRQALFDRQVQLTTAVFYNDYKNLQVDVRARPAYPAITTAIINANSARTWGAEAGVSWRVIDPLTLGLSAGYLNAKYKNFKLVGSAALADFDLSGEQMPKSPKVQLGFNADLDQPLNGDLRLVGNLLVSHASNVIYMYSALPGTLPNANAPDYWITNVRLGIKTTDDKYGFAVIADNLFNEKYYTEGNASPMGDGVNWGAPRIVRGEFTVKF